MNCRTLPSFLQHDSISLRDVLQSKANEMLKLRWEIALTSSRHLRCQLPADKLSLQSHSHNLFSVRMISKLHCLTLIKHFAYFLCRFSVQFLAVSLFFLPVFLHYMEHIVKYSKFVFVSSKYEHLSSIFLNETRVKAHCIRRLQRGGHI